jgi:hypothetical protein
MDTKELEAYKRRLAILREKAAVQGLRTPPEISIEIEDITSILRGKSRKSNSNRSRSRISKKQDAYLELLEHLRRLFAYVDRYYSAMIAQMNENREVTDRLSAEYKDSFEYARKQALVNIYISEEAISDLQYLVKELSKRDHNDDMMDIVEYHYEIILKCIAKVRISARSDLLGE